MRRKLVMNIRYFLFCAAFSVVLTSCGLVEFDMNDEAQPVMSMTLDHDTVYVMQGDRFVLKPVFTPDTISNQAVLYVSNDTEVAAVEADSIHAVGTGWTTITAMSVSGRFMATCEVCVMPRWEVSPYSYPDEMFVCARVSIRGKEPDDDTMVAALINDEVRGVGQWLTVGNYRCMVFRILNSGVGHVPDRVEFACYNRKTFRVEYFKQWLIYDGEAHGTPANPIPLTID